MSDTIHYCRDCGACLTADEPHRVDCRQHEEPEPPQTLDELLASGDPDEAYEAWWL